MDADGLGVISYQWQRDGADVAGATGNTYTLGNADVGHAIDVVAKYTDGHGTAEVVTSAATSSVTNVNDPPTGAVTISGTAQENQVLTASNTLADADGLGAISYQWQRDGVDVAGATGPSYALGNADVGHAIDVVAKYTDGHGTAEAVTSPSTAAVTNVNDPPTGAVTISGTAQENQVLTASNTLADADGLGAISYQWQRDGINVVGATGPSYTLGNADVGHSIDVVAKYTDGDGTAEAVTSATTSAVTNVNDPPTGSVTISGTAQENQVLTASNTLADADGLGAISYQWQRDGVDVAGATGPSYTLGNADVGHAIDVVAKYTDGHGTAESVTSASRGGPRDACRGVGPASGPVRASPWRMPWSGASLMAARRVRRWSASRTPIPCHTCASLLTATVTNVNDPPTGSVTISPDRLRKPRSGRRRQHAGGLPMGWVRSAIVAARAVDAQARLGGTFYTLGNADVSHSHRSWWRSTPTAMAPPRAWRVLRRRR